MTITRSQPRAKRFSPEFRQEFTAIVRDVVREEFAAAKAAGSPAIIDGATDAISEADLNGHNEDLQSVIAAAKNLRETLKLWPITGKPKWNRITDGSALNFLDRHYGAERDAGILYQQLIRDTDRSLHDAIERERRNVRTNDGRRAELSVAKVYGEALFETRRKVRADLDTIIGCEPMAHARLLKYLLSEQTRSATDARQGALFGR